MGYRWKLCTQWSRRDRLTIVIIAVATAFLVGTTLLLVAANTQTSAISSGFNDSMDVTHYDSVAAADSVATNDDIVLPVAAVKRNGTTEYVVGVPPDAPTVLKKVSVSWREARFPQPPSNATFAGPVGGWTQQRFVGTNHTETVSVAPTSTEKSVFPRSWYIGKPATVRSLGTTDAYVVHTTSASNGGDRLRSETGVITPGLYRYFIAGMQGVVSLLGLAVLGGGVLVLVVVYNVTRMSVRDRLDAIEVVRATGGTPRRLLVTFGVRAGLLTVVGIALGCHRHERRRQRRDHRRPPDFARTDGESGRAPHHRSGSRRPVVRRYRRGRSRGSPGDDHAPVPTQTGVHSGFEAETNR